MEDAKILILNDDDIYSTEWEEDINVILIFVMKHVVLVILENFEAILYYVPEIIDGIETKVIVY